MRPRALRSGRVKPRASSRWAAVAASRLWDEVMGAMWRTRHERSSSSGNGDELGCRRLVMPGRFRQPLDELAYLRLVDDERREHAHDIVAGRDGEQAVLAQMIDEGAAV